MSDTAVELADHTAIIPMAGFVESYNISVAAALIMYEAQQQRIRQVGKSGDLTEQQKQQLLASFLLRGVVSVWCTVLSALVTCIHTHNHAVTFTVVSWLATAP